MHIEATTCYSWYPPTSHLAFLQMIYDYYKPEPRKSTRKETPRSIIISFLNNSQYRQSRYAPLQALEQELVSEMESWKLPFSHLMPMIPPSCAMAEMSYHGHNPSVKKVIALFTFFMIYIDDMSSRRDPAPFASFQHLYHSNQPQLDPILDHFATFLRSFWDFYGAFSANAIVSSTLEFVNGCYLESLTAGMPVNQSATRFPYFLRSKTGVAQAYAFMIFPKTEHKELTQYIQVSLLITCAGQFPSELYPLQAIPDICYWIDIVNDVLSFHKEELAGETENYVHLRAALSGEQPIVVVRELANEALKAAEGIEAVLDSTQLEAWKTFKVGYISFHLSQERYRLSDLQI